MGVQKDESGRRWVQVEVEVPGSPEEVWKAIATGPGVSAWFVPTEIREDGSVVSHFGPGMDAVATRTGWDPPHRFAAESGMMGPDGPKMATEWTVEARDGGKCVVRVVHSLFSSTDDWDDQLGAVERGWPDYFRILKLYLARFRGEKSSGIQLLGIASDPPEKIWEAVSTPLGLSGAVAGGRFQSARGAPAIAGTVEEAGSQGHPHQVLARLDAPTAGTAHLFAMAMGGSTVVSLRLYLYGEAAEAVARREEPRWKAWFTPFFPTSPAAPPC